MTEITAGSAMFKGQSFPVGQEDLDMPVLAAEEGV
jgi:hypothetical protein